MSNSIPYYANFNQAQKQLHGIEAIDYFFAKEIIKSLCFDSPGVSTEQQNTAFHLFIVLSQSLREGHTCLPIDSLVGQCVGLASDNDGVISHHGYRFASNAEITHCLDSFNLNKESKQPIVFENECLYIRRYYDFEQELSTAICADDDGAIKYDHHHISRLIKQLFPEDENDVSDVSELDWQKLAVANALNKRFSIIAGGPGTGKTYTVTKLLAALVALEQQTESDNGVETKVNIALVAPTGKAAQRLSESIGNALQGFRGQIADKILDEIPIQAQTIHRLLGVLPNNPNFRHNADNKLSIDVLLIDEVSMVDLAMMTRIFRAISNSTRVILLGDADQLPSVAAGSVLSDLAVRPHLGYSKDNLAYLSQVTGYKTLPKAKKHSADHITYLTKSRRFDGTGGIGKLASAVINGESGISWQLMTATDNSKKTDILTQDLSLLADDTMEWLPRLVDNYYLPLYTLDDVSSAFELFSRFRILCATRRGEQGVEQLNVLVESYLKNIGILRYQGHLFHGQPIMISENDYRLNLFNGDIGFMWQNEQGQLMAVFEGGADNPDNNYQWIMPSRLPKFETVYAMTIHKTQGSEFNHVAMVLPKQVENKLLSRELLYTGITRAKEKFSLSSHAHVWRHAVDVRVQRYSSLKLTTLNLNF